MHFLNFSKKTCPYRRDELLQTIFFRNTTFDTGLSKCDFLFQMNVKKVFEKVNEWQAAAVQIKKHVPVDDAVLIFFYRQLQDFKQELPLLYKLSSDALKVQYI
jgi:hypothetical protein